MEMASKCLCIHCQYSALHTVQVRTHTAEVRVGLIENGKSIFYYWSHTDFCGVGTDVQGVQCSVNMDVLILLFPISMQAFSCDT